MYYTLKRETAESIDVGFVESKCGTRQFITNEGIIVDFRSAVRLPYEPWSVADTTRAPRQTSSVARVFFPYAPSQA